MTILGRNVDDGSLVRLGYDARARGTYIVGATGTGKTTLLQSIAHQDMLDGHGVCVLDPHGDMIDWLLERVPSTRKDDVIYFNPADDERPFGLNLLACDRNNPHEVRWVVNTFVATLRRLYEWSWGPLLEHVLNHTLWTAMAIRDERDAFDTATTLVEVLLLLTSEEYRRGVVDQIDEPLLQNFWREFPRGERQRLEFTSSTVNKLTPFLLDETMRHIVGQARNTFDLQKVMDERKVLLVNLAKGELGENNSALLGSILVNLILMAALRRRNMDPARRKQLQFHVIVDEYQNFASDSFSVLQSEARKYGVALVVAHQFRDQLTREMGGSALNVGNFVFFRVTGVDGPELAAQFDNSPPPPRQEWEAIRQPVFEYPGEYRRGSRDVKVEGPQRLYADMTLQRANELSNLDPFRAQARLIVQHEATDDGKESGRLRLREYQIGTIDPEGDDTLDDARLADIAYGTPDPSIAKYIRERSRRMAPKKIEVKREIDRRTRGLASMTNPAHLVPPVPPVSLGPPVVAHDTASSHIDWTKHVSWATVNWADLFTRGGLIPRVPPKRKGSRVSVQLSERDQAILQMVWDCDGIVARRHLQELFWAGKDKSGARQRLRALYDAKYLNQPHTEKQCHGAPEHIYWLDRHGYTLFGIDGNARNLSKIRTMNVFVLRHHLELIDLRLKIIGDVLQADEWELQRWITERVFKAARPQVITKHLGKGKQVGVEPDGFFSVACREGSGLMQHRNFVLEWDRATEDQGRIEEKLLKGALFLDSEPYRELTDAEGGRCLMITTSWDRAENMMKRAEAANVGWAWYFTTREEVLAPSRNSLLDAVWRIVGSSEAVSILTSPGSDTGASR